MAERFERERIRQIAREQLLRAFDPFARDAFLPLAEKFGIFWFKKKMRHQFERFALIPEDLRRLRDRRGRQIRNDRALFERHWPRRTDHGVVFVAKDHATDLRLEVSFVLHELFLEM